MQFSKINDAQAAKLLATHEGHFVDLKAIDIKPAKLTKTFSAFANTDGGEVYVGIDENKTTGVRSWRGFADMEAANGHLQAFEPLFPLGLDFLCEFIGCDSQPGISLHSSSRRRILFLS